MTASNRAAKIAKTHKVLKKHYKPVAPADRSLLEHLLYACCLENALFEQADEAFAKLQQLYFDWNEIRVTTTTELAEVMSSLPDPPAAAKRLKSCLQSVFESHYTFDLEFFKKQNLGKSVKSLEQFNGATPFIVAYATQVGLGGHSIPVNDGALQVFLAVDVISEAEAAKHRVPGLERAIAKNKGIEFGSLLHQLGVEFGSGPFSPRVRAIICEIDPEAKSRLPKRSAKKTKADKTGSKKTAPKKAAPKKSAKKQTAEAAKAKTRPKSKPPGKTAKKSTKSTASKSKSARSGGKKSTTKKLSKKKPR